ncbi:RNA polymerase sigma factor [Neobacillus sp. LXY-4]|uniref:RNA polymerase sigma factor n=1 Tax=Neobacillus sp. LXY-4 TaxID=3379826 RepID=UPI003EDE7B70
METIEIDQLFTLYSKRLHNIALSVTKDWYLAEDVVQETFLKAYKKIETIEDPKKIAAWLSSIAARTAIDFLRAERRKKCCPTNQTIIENALFNSESRHLTEEEVEIRLLETELNGSLAELSKEYKEVLILRIRHGLNEKEIAQKLQLKSTTVKNRLYRARKQLKETLINKYSA